jgi:hypothetical protein
MPLVALAAFMFTRLNAAFAANRPGNLIILMESTVQGSATMCPGHVVASGVRVLLGTA